MTRGAATSGLLRRTHPDQIKTFQRQWYGVTKSAREQQCVYALTAAGLGKRVSWHDARSGDFLQLWRAKSGHSVIFLGWITYRGRAVGLRYWSTLLDDGCTDSYAMEYVASALSGHFTCQNARTPSRAIDRKQARPKFRSLNQRCAVRPNRVRS